MRIAILGCRGIPARHGGFETFAEGISQRLKQRGHVVTVYCEGRRRGRPRTCGGVRLVYIPVPASGCLRPLVYDMLALMHASVGHDVVYLLGYGAALFGVIPRLFGREFWVNMDGLEWKRSKWSRPARLWFRIMERMAMSVASLVIFDAEAIRRDLCGRLKPPRASAVLTYAAEPRLEAPNSTILETYDLREDEYHLIVCRLEPENHVLEIVRGYNQAALQRPLVIVADHTLNTPYAQRCLAASGSGVRWIGTVWNREHLASLRAGATCYAHGHSVGGTNPSLLEAMGCGSLCLAHDNTFNREVLGEQAFYFANEQEVIAGFLQVDGLEAAARRKMGHACRSRVNERYDWERLADSYGQLLAPQGPALDSTVSERTPNQGSPRTPEHPALEDSPVASEVASEAESKEAA